MCLYAQFGVGPQVYTWPENILFISQLALL